MYSSFNNIRRSWNELQGFTHPTDSHVQILRDYNQRYITVQNSSTRPVGVAITSYLSGPTPFILFNIQGGEIKHLGINSHGSHPQYIWLLDVQTKLPVMPPTLIRSNANDLVLRDGINKWSVQFFRRPSYAAAK